MALINVALASTHGTLQAGVFALGLLAISIVFVAIYRITLHPLAKYPGPLSCRVSGWPDGLSALSGDRHLYQWQLHEIYGPVVRILPNLLSINTAEALKGIYGSGRANVIKGDWYKVIHAIEGGWSTHSCIPTQIHSRKRRRLAHAFSDNAVKGAEAFILQNLDIGLSQLAERKDVHAEKVVSSWSKPRDMSQWASWMSLDILGDLCFGKTFNCMRDKENRWIPNFITESTGYIYFMGYIPVATLLRPIMRLGVLDKIGGEMARKNKFFVDWSHVQMEQRVNNDQLAHNANRRDFVHYLLRGRDPEAGNTGITMEELKSEAATLIVAGSDTSAITLSAIFFYLVRNSVALDKLTRDIRSTFTDIDEIKSGSKLNGLSYLRACIDETLRMTPPVGGILPRKVLPGGLHIDGVGDIPEGVEVGTAAYAIHHSETYYSEPFAFRPERWIADEKNGVTAESVELAQSAFCPFSLGTRGCIGKGLAYAELSVCIARVLFLYDVRLAPGDTTGEGRPELSWGRRRRGEQQTKDMFVAEREGPFVEFRNRVAAKSA